MNAGGGCGKETVEKSKCEKAEKEARLLSFNRELAQRARETEQKEKERGREKKKRRKKRKEFLLCTPQESRQANSTSYCNTLATTSTIRIPIYCLIVGDGILD